MNAFNHFIVVLGLTLTGPSIAQTCTQDLELMKAQVSQFGSIHTQKCPLNYFGWGITQVSDVVQLNDKHCFARCKYAYYTGSSGTDCTWVTSDWGNTLACE